MSSLEIILKIWSKSSLNETNSVFELTTILMYVVFLASIAALRHSSVFLIRLG